jgi:hypothetical protein
MGVCNRKYTLYNLLSFDSIVEKKNFWNLLLYTELVVDKAGQDVSCVTDFEGKMYFLLINLPAL